MVHVPPEPAASDTDAVATRLRHSLSCSTPDQECREVDPGVDGQLQRTPESPIDLHDDLPTRPSFPLTLDHRDALPVERVEQAQTGTGEALVERDALSVHADAAGGRPLPQAATGATAGPPAPPPPRQEAFTHRPHRTHAQRADRDVTQP